MFWQSEFKSHAHLLENRVFFCLERVPSQIERRQKDMRDVIVINLSPFKGKFDNQRDVDEFDRVNNVLWLEGEAMGEKKICILVAPNLITAQITYALMRDWCPTGAKHIQLSFEDTNLVPLIEKPRH